MLIMEFTKPASRKEIEKSLAPFLTFIASGEEIPLKDIAKKLQKEGFEVIKTNRKIIDTSNLASIRKFTKIHHTTDILVLNDEKER